MLLLSSNVFSYTGITPSLLPAVFSFWSPLGITDFPLLISKGAPSRREGTRAAAAFAFAFRPAGRVGLAAGRSRAIASARGGRQAAPAPSFFKRRGVRHDIHLGRQAAVVRITACAPLSHDGVHAILLLQAGGSTTVKSGIAARPPRRGHTRKGKGNPQPFEEWRHRHVCCSEQP